jgi:hypothetical protein
MAEIATLDEFLTNDADRGWVFEEGFDNLYVRKGCRYINGKFYENVFDIGSVTASVPGEGAFTALIAKLVEKWDGPIFVENVLTPRFATALLQAGFVPANQHLLGSDDPMIPRCFVLRLDAGKETETPRRMYWGHT